jgi:hypothetical protein
VELLEITVADQVSPQPPVGGPAGLVDQYRHAPILRPCPAGVALRGALRVALRRCGGIG